jgi:PPOX class probable F420-dependent enzyme
MDDAADSAVPHGLGDLGGDPPVSDFHDLGDQRFVSLTTYRRTGVPVSTPVWVARDGDDLLVTTPAGSGKVKRLRHTARVELVPCSRSGKVAPGARPVQAIATLGEPDRPAVFRAKYGLEYRVFMLVERIVARGNRDRVLVRIRPA